MSSTSDRLQVSTAKADPTTTPVPDSTTIPTTFTSPKMSSHQMTTPFKTTTPEPEVSTKGVSTPPSSTVKESRGGIVKAEKIHFGGKGKGDGKFKKARGVAVSEDNEIFVADVGNRRVQVFSMNGDFLRQFPAVVPGKNGQKMQPCDVAIDNKGFVWVAGSSVDSKNHAHVVKYSKEGQPKQDPILLQNKRVYPPSIVFDSTNNKIIVAANTVIHIFSTAGYLDTKFKSLKAVSFITSDNKGNILATGVAESRVRVYNHRGRLQFRFGSDGKRKGKLTIPTGICTDKSGNIIIANWLNHRIDMFTSRGKFVRTVVQIDSPYGIAVGPGGHLVVTNLRAHTVTIFPRHMVFP
ncbi:E3 ubiquitin-protein ligase TRIM32-like [Branchiostoma floridae x Branchiostoma japonicum]